MPRDDDCFDVSNLFLSVVSHYRDWCYAFSLLVDSYAFCNQGAEVMESAIGGLRLLTLKTLVVLRQNNDICSSSSKGQFWGFETIGIKLEVEDQKSKVEGQIWD
ncbi:unnamed protein product [Lactuca virosa]|uniref:Uncharacterized protein n=1 Tax=Lactuca virosa TaxID=75947 RepID=A0AAU9NU53_9ASTR|nr:unnamed protein product [Lactuca virosa]